MASAISGFVADVIGIQATFALLSIFILLNMLTIALLFHTGIYRRTPVPVRA